MVRKRHALKGFNATFERMEPRILLSADALGGALGIDTMDTSNQDNELEINNSDDLHNFIAPYLPSNKIDNTANPDAINHSATYPTELSIQQLDNLLSNNDIQYDNNVSAIAVDDENFTNTVSNDLSLLLNTNDRDNENRHELIFIDTNTPDYETLIEDITNQNENNNDTNYAIFLLNSEHNGIQQISDILSQQKDIDAIHIVSHGNQGILNLGNTQLTNNNVNQYTSLLNNWTHALDNDADLLIYGCNLAANDAGKALIESLSQTIDIDIAASDDLTGLAELGGDWDFEVQYGSIETGIAFSLEIQQNWQGLLATFTVNTTNDTIDANVGDGLAIDADGNTSLRAAIMEANANIDADEITLGSGTYILTLGSSDENSGAEGDLDITTDLTITGADASNTIIDGNGNDRVFELRNGSENVTFSNITIQGGVTNNDGGGIHIQSNSSVLTADHIIIDNNQANKGAGVFNRGTFNLTDAIISNNGSLATAEGGGISNHEDVNLNRVTVNGNTANNGGGLHQDNSAKSFNVTNTTVSSNTAIDLGGGLYAQENALLANATFTLNHANNDGGGVYRDGGTTSVRNTIISGNTAAGVGNDVHGSFLDLTKNLIEDTSGSTGFSNTFSILGVSANLDVLADNGGFGLTHALLAGSDAIDAAGTIGTPSVDQHNHTRDSSPDIGAVEFGATAPNTNPTIANPISNQNATEDTPFNFTFNANTFNDVDVADTLTYTAQLSGGGSLPGWLNFDSGTRTFSGTPLNADVGALTIEIIASDGNTGTVTDTFDLLISNTNDDPTVDNPIANQNATEDTPFSFTFNANTFDDVDSGNTLSYTAKLIGGGPLPSWLNFNAATRTFSGTPINSDVRTLNIEVTADDSNGGTVTDAFDLVINNSNDDPTIDNPIANQSATEDTPFSFTFNANTFDDVDVGDTLTYTAQLSGGGSLPGWLSFDSGTRTFSGTPLNADVGTLTIEVIANDGNTGTVTDAFDLVISNSNDDPTVDNPIANQSATEDTPFSFTFNANTFDDVDVGDTLTYTAQLSGGGSLPGWLSFDSGTRTFSGTPLNADVGTLTIEVIASDGNTGTVTDIFDLVIGNSNDDPTVDNPIANQSATEDTPFSFTFNTNTFGDVDVGDTLTYTAQLSGGGSLPGWLSFDSGTRTFSGTPLNADVGTLTIEVTANDGNTGTVTDAFDLVISNSNDDPTVDNPIANQSATEDTPFSFTFNANTFDDVDVGDTLTYTAQLSSGGSLPGWLSFDSGTRTFSGTPLDTDVGILTIAVISDDSNGGMTTSTFSIVINEQPLFRSIQLSEDIRKPSPDDNTLDNELTLDQSSTQSEEKIPETEKTTETEIISDTESIPENQVLDSDIINSFTESDTSNSSNQFLPNESNTFSSINNTFNSSISSSVDIRPNQAQPIIVIDEPYASLDQEQSLITKIQHNFKDLSNPASLISTQEFTDGLNLLRKEILQENEKSEEIIGNTTVVSASLSAGYIVWLARSGVLMSSILSAMPAWRFIDPLPILNSVNMDENDDDESLESLVNSNQQEPDSNYNKKDNSFKPSSEKKP